MITLLILMICLSMPLPVFAAGSWYHEPYDTRQSDVMQPGTRLNPYVVGQDAYGTTTIRPQYSSPEQGVMAPGSRLNPYQIRQDAFGRTIITTPFPADNGEED